MMRWPLRKGNLLYREPSQDQSAEAILVGDIYEWTDPPFYEVDPRTMQCTTTLQAYRIVNTQLKMQPVRRGSFRPR